MPAETSLQDGDLQGALTLLQQQIRQNPADAKLRVFLFQLRAIMGQWERALNQLDVAGELDAGVLAMVQTYREALQCEVLRAEVFAGKRSAMIFGQPDGWLALLMEGQRLTAECAYEQAKTIFDQTLDAAPPISGQIDGVPFDWIMDGDTRLGPVLEAVVNGRYYWIPLHRIRSIDIEKPEDLRDLVWMPAHFTWANGGEMVGLIPTRYPGSESATDPLLSLARKTEWLEPVPGLYLGQGQRMLLTEGGEFPLMDVRRIEFATSDRTESASG